MMKKILVLSLMMFSLSAAAGNEMNQILVAANSDCADECLNLKEFNSGEAFYIWTTSSVKIA